MSNLELRTANGFLLGGGETGSKEMCSVEMVIYEEAHYNSKSKTAS